jgi:hypothetical protein
MMTRNLLLITLGVQLPHARASGQPVEAVAPENAIDPGVRNFDVVISRQISDDPDRPQVIFATKIQDLLDNLGRCLIGRVLRNRFGVLETGFTMLLVCVPSSI